jgi:hypothetical protein
VIWGLSDVCAVAAGAVVSAMLNERVYGYQMEGLGILGLMAVTIDWERAYIWGDNQRV